MLKKGLFLVAAVAILAVSAQAGEVKLHSWPCAFVPQELVDVLVQIDVGYFISISQNKKIKLTQSTTSPHNFQGCTNLDVQTNFDAVLSCSIEKTGTDVGGQLSCYFDNVPGTTEKEVAVTGTGKATIQICAEAKNINMAVVPAGSTNVTIAVVHIKVVPNLAPGGCSI